MTTSSQIEELLQKCEDCSGGDSRSYEEHFADCPQCKQYAEAAEKANKQLNFLEELASKPYDSAKSLLGARMRSFLGMPPEDRKAAISDLLDGLGDIPTNARIKVVKARTDLIMEMPKEHRNTLMGVLKEIMSTWPPERKMLEKQAVMKATEDYFFLKKKMVRKNFGALLA
jgi:hypothetical protein